MTYDSDEGDVTLINAECECQKNGASSLNWECVFYIEINLFKLTNDSPCQLCHHLLGSPHLWWLRGCEQTPVKFHKLFGCYWLPGQTWIAEIGLDLVSAGWR